jgi:glycosyltransferase involved in cell wall biosynthesis
LNAGHAVEIFGIALTGGPLYPVPPATLKVTQVRGWRTLHSLLKLLLRLDGDIIYAIKPRPSSYGVALLKRRLTGCPVILDIDDWEPAEAHPAAGRPGASPARPRGRRGIASRLKGPLRAVRRSFSISSHRYIHWLDRAIPGADALTVNTRFVQNRYGGTYVPQCKDGGLFDPAGHDPEASRARYGLTGYSVLMFPGTPRPHKGLEDILAALDILGNPAIKLVLVGGRSSGEAYIDELLQRGRQWIVRLPAFPIEEMPRVVAAAHLVVVAQRDTAIARAQFPMKLTDAMAMAKPIVTTTVGDIPEILGNTGYLVQPSSPEQLAAAIDRILKNPAAACRRGRAARERFVCNYSLDAVSPLLSGVIERLGGMRYAHRK